MIRFECDYGEGAHERILKRLTETNFDQTPGYGEDDYCESARALIRNACAAPDADVHFLVGGTQANMTVIASILKPYQGAVAADTGHINVHETGAVESTGHKVLPLPEHDGKLSAAQVESLCRAHYADSSFEHMAQPGLVYISHPTECGTLYTLSELTALRKVCDAYHMPLFLDGARLGYGLMAEGTDVTLPDIARLCDVFYIGGTKVGALFGEAVVITNPALKKDFRYNMKQRGAMLAKGRLLGIQFEELFRDGLYFEISRHADEQALRIRDAFRQKGASFYRESPTNQQFPILSDAQAGFLKNAGYSFSLWTRTDETHAAVRFCASWATKTENVDALIRDIDQMPEG